MADKVVCLVGNGMQEKSSMSFRQLDRNCYYCAMRFANKLETEYCVFIWVGMVLNR